jgi:hypothetical protein
VKIVDEATPKETTTDKIKRVLNELCAGQKKDDEPTTHFSAVERVSPHHDWPILKPLIWSQERPTKNCPVMAECW